MTHRLLLALLLALALTAAAGDARAQSRYAAVVGVNEGDVDDARLLYAERDAARIADVLTRLGDVPAENLLLLRGADADAVEHLFRVLRDRIRAEPSGERPLLFIYYSGHADAQALRMRGTRLPFARLKALAREVGAEVSVFVVDACRSGGLTRVKGASPAPPFEIRADDHIDSEGLAIITSSAEGEDAQESERLKGGIFTHHLVGGLVGAADTSGDRRITLSEAYRYAYAQTLRATSETPTVQHPTYAFAMKGRRELVLTRLTDDRGLGRLAFGAPGHYLVLERFGAGDVAAELEAEAATELLVAPGRYLVRRRAAGGVWEGQVAVAADARAEVRVAELSRVPFRETVRKGYAPEAGSAWSLGGAFEISGPPLPDTGLGLYGALTAQLDLADVTLALRLRYGRSSSANETLTLTQDLFGLDLGVFKLFDLSRGLAAGIGVRVGGDFVSQRFDTRGRAPSRGVALGRLAPVVRLEAAPTPAVGLALDCGADIAVVELQDEDGSGLATPVVPFCSLGLALEVR
ncbi:MAG: caspase family protein [Deltaproteobacteria bacterium]|nr:MAG: caspase family protein [Deltaproteobacteria bacterium]